MEQRIDNAIDYASATTPKPRRKVHPVVACVYVCLLLASFSAFAISLWLPGVQTGNGPSTPGWGCVIFGWIYWPSNLLFLMAPMVSIRLFRSNGGVLFVDAILYLLSAVFVSLVPYFLRYFTGFDGTPQPDIGLYIWALAHWGVALAFMLLWI